MGTIRRITQNRFNAGEFSPLLDARLDVSSYRSGCRRLKNFVPLVHGAATRRPGLQFLQFQKNMLVPGRVTPFVFSTDNGQSYFLEHGIDADGHGYIRFHWNDGLITTPATTAAVTNGSFASNITGWTDASAGGAAISWDATLHALSLDTNNVAYARARQQVSHTSGGVLHVLAFHIVTGPVQVRVGTSAGAEDLIADTELPEGFYILSFTPSVGNTAFHLQFASSPSAVAKKVDDVYLQTGPLTLRTPFVAAEDLLDHYYTQSLDVVYLCQGNIPPYKLVRLSHTSWRMERIVWGPDIEPPVGLTATVVGTAGSRTLNYVVTAVDQDTEEQSLPCAMATVTTANDALTEANYVLNEWLPLERGKEYRVFRLKNGVWGFLDSAGQPENISPVNIVMASKANPCSISAPGHDLEAGEHIWIQDVGGMTEINGKFYTVISVDSEFFCTAQVIPANTSAVGDEGGKALGWAAGGFYIDIVAKTNIKMAGNKTLTMQLGHSSSAGSDYADISGAVATKTSDGSTIPAGAVLGSIPVPATALAYVRVVLSTNDASATGTIDAYAIGTFRLKGVDATSFTDFTSGGTARRACWYIDDGSKKPDSTDTPPIRKDPFEDPDEWPETVSFFEQRLMLATGPKVRGSQSANYENMNVSQPLVDSDALTYRIADGQDNRVLWMIPLDKLVIGTSGAEWLMSGKDSNPLAPGGGIKISRESGRGSRRVRPVLIGKNILFVDRVGNIREFFYALATDSYDAGELSVLAEHVLESRDVVDQAYQQGPHGLDWIVLSDGQALCLAYNKEQEVTGFARVVTDGEIESVACIPGDPGDVVAFTVRRYRHFIGWDWDISDTQTGVAGEVFMVPDGQTFEAGNVLRGLGLGGTLRWFQYKGAKSLSAGLVTCDDTAVESDEIESIHTGGALNASFWDELTSPREYIRTVERLADFFTSEEGEIPYGAKFLDSALTLDNAQDIGFVDITNPVSLTVTGHGLAPGDTVLITDCLGLQDPVQEISGLNDFHFKVHEVLDADTLTLADESTEEPVDASAWTIYEGGGVIRKCVTVLTGLDHLHGRTVEVCADGAEVPECVVGDSSLGWARGSIQLPSPAGVVHVGLGFDSDLIPMKPDIADETGSTIGISKQIGTVWVTVQESIGFEYGNTEDELQERTTREDGDLLSQAPRLKNVSVLCEMPNQEANSDSFVLIRMSGPHPLTILALTMQMEIMDQ